MPCRHRKMSCRHRKMSSLPQDLIREILLWLPVKSLVRFQSVSKPWRSLIRDSSFIEVQLQRSIQTRSERFLLLHCSKEYCLVDVKKEVQFDNPMKFIQLSSIVREWGNLICAPYISNHCNGLFCRANFKKEIAIWNPSIRKHKKIPSIKVDAFNYDRKFFNVDIGYDPVNNDYKVVNVVESSVFPIEYEVLVYSLKENSWRRVEDKWPLKHSRLGNGTCLNGIMNWLVETEEGRNNQTVLVTFDLTNEKFQVHPIPTEFLFTYSLNVIGGKLCARGGSVFPISRRPRPNRWWMMEEYGVASSWCLLYKEHHCGEKPLMISDDGQEILIQGYKKYFWYDRKKKTNRNVEIPDIPKNCNPKTSQGNLFLIDGD